MKICITSQGESLESQVDPRFGRCQYFIIFDTETGKFEAIENSNITASGGAGIQSGQLIASKGVEVVLTGNVGPNAFQTLQAGGIKVITGISGDIKQAIEKYKNGELNSTQSPTVGSKFGMSGGGIGGFGRGMRGVQSVQSSEEEAKQSEGKKQGLEALEEEAENLEKKAKEIRRRIDELKSKG